MKVPAYLFGPFVGELSWEFYRFAPYTIHLKKEHPNIQHIICTRSSRFDLYGQYADILVPLRIPNDSNEKQDSFKLESLVCRDYNKIARILNSQYKKNYEIIDHIYPDIKSWRYKLKWQFHRRHMDYDFKPREKNKRIARTLLKHNDIIIDYDVTPNEYTRECITVTSLYSKMRSMINDYDATILGVMIECLKICRAVVGSFNSDISHLALLLKKPLICINNKLSEDSIKLLNPFNTPIIFETNILDGIKTYENLKL